MTQPWEIENLLQRFVISSPQWGDVSILRPVPDDVDGWGVFRYLQGTPWGEAIPVVDGVAMSHALHGHTTPLMNQIGRPPQAQLKALSEQRCLVATQGCPTYDKAACFPGKRVPLCYQPAGLDPVQRTLAITLTLAWKENRYVIVVEGSEFSL